VAAPAATPEAKPPSDRDAGSPAAGSEVAPAAGWKETVNEAGRVAIALPPGTPVDETLPTLPGIASGTLFGVALEGNRGRLTVTSMKLPAAVPSSQTSTFLTQARDGALKVIPGAKVVSETKIQLGDHPAWNSSSTAPVGKSITKVYLVKERVFQPVRGAAWRSSTRRRSRPSTTRSGSWQVSLSVGYAAVNLICDMGIGTRS